MCETLANGGAGGSPLGDEALAAAAARAWYSIPMRTTTCWRPWQRRSTSGRPSTSTGSKAKTPCSMGPATGLRPVLNGLDGADLERFLAVYRERLRAAYPRRPDGYTVYPFRRLFLVATRRD